MPKYLVHRTYAAYVTDVYEVEAENEEDANELMNNSGATWLEVNIGDTIPWVMDAEDFYIKETDNA